ncbi:hypothetical protein ACFX2F_027327 [Malus domestica]
MATKNDDASSSADSPDPVLEDEVCFHFCVLSNLTAFVSASFLRRSVLVRRIVSMWKNLGEHVKFLSFCFAVRH